MHRKEKTHSLVKLQLKFYFANFEKRHPALKSRRVRAIAGNVTRTTSISYVCKIGD
jgi:hypothetical protein